MISIVGLHRWRATFFLCGYAVNKLLLIIVIIIIIIMRSKTICIHSIRSTTGHVA